MSDSDREVIVRYIEATESLDIDSIMALWADDGVFELPYAIEGMPGRVEGAAAIREYLGQLPAILSRLDYSEPSIVGADGAYAVECTSEADVAKPGVPTYRNTYIIVVEVRDGRIALWREYFDPRPTQALFAALMG